MKNGYRCFLMLLPFASISSGATEFNEVLAGKSAVTFAYRQMNVPMEGNFSKFSARIAFDPAKAGSAQAKIEVDLASIDAGSSDANDEVGGKLWFNTKAFPVAQFVSTGVKTLGNNRYEALGKLTIKGKSMDVVAPFTFRQEGPVAAFDGSFNLKRLDYAIGEGMWADLGTVANEIQVVFHIVAGAAPAKK